MNQYRSYGHTRPKSVRDRLLSHCKQEARGYESPIGVSSPCLVWTGQKDKYNYGRIKRDNKWVPTHWILIGDPPPGMEVDHKCNQHDCVRPSHLQFVTRQENVRLRDERIQQSKRTE